MALQGFGAVNAGLGYGSSSFPTIVDLIPIFFPHLSRSSSVTGRVHDEQLSTSETLSSSTLELTGVIRLRANQALHTTPLRSNNELRDLKGSLEPQRIKPFLQLL